MFLIAAVSIISSLSRSQIIDLGSRATNEGENFPQAMQCIRYLVCTNHRCSILSFTRSDQRVYRAWCRRILKARLASLALSSRSPNPGVRNKASTPVTVAGIFTTLLSAHIKKRCEQQSEREDDETIHQVKHTISTRNNGDLKLWTSPMFRNLFLLNQFRHRV